jgi:hypothetical protein
MAAGDRGSLPRALRVPHPDRLPPGTPGYDTIRARHDAAVDAGEPGYADPASGLFVMTAATHWARGSCCDSGCRHCPFLPR